MGAVYKKEFKSLMTGIYGFAFAAILLCVVGLLMYYINLQIGLADVSYNLVGYPEYVLCLTIPVLCMRSVTCDRKRGTDRLYFSLPIRTSTVVLGKFLALLTVLAIPMVLIALYPLLLRSFGDVNLGSAYASVAMFFLLGAALIAMCMFIATLTRYTAVSVLVGVLACAALYFMPRLALLVPYTALASFVGFGILAILAILVAWLATKRITVTAITAAVTILPLTILYVLDVFVCHWGLFEGAISLLMMRLSPFEHFLTTVSDQYFDLFAVAVILAFTAFFLLLTVQSLERRRKA